MIFDIDQVVKDMSAAISETVKEDAGDVGVSVKAIMETEKASLKELGDARLKGDIDDMVFNREIEREKKVVEVELLTIKIMTKALAQKAVNAAIDVFVKAVKAAIPSI